MTRPFVSIDPAMQSGRPCVSHTRLTVETVAVYIWGGYTPEDVAEEFDVTPADVLVACWYAGTYGIPGSWDWRARWGKWAEDVHENLWHGRYDIPMPPSEKGRPDDRLD